MRIVVTQQPGSVTIVQCQRITDSMRNVPARRHFPCLNPDPVPSALVVDLSVQQQKRFQASIRSQIQIIIR